MIAHNHISIDVQPLFFLAIRQAFHNNRSVAIARKDIDPADDGQGQIVHGLLVCDSVASHSFSTKIRTGFIGQASFEKHFLFSGFQVALQRGVLIPSETGG